MSKKQRCWRKQMEFIAEGPWIWIHLCHWLCGWFWQIRWASISTSVKNEDNRIHLGLQDEMRLAQWSWHTRMFHYCWPSVFSLSLWKQSMAIFVRIDKYIILIKCLDTKKNWLHHLLNFLLCMLNYNLS